MLRRAEWLDELGTPLLERLPVTASGAVLVGRPRTGAFAGRRRPAGLQREKRVAVSTASHRWSVTVGSSGPTGHPTMLKAASHGQVSGTPRSSVHSFRPRRPSRRRVVTYAAAPPLASRSLTAALAGTAQPPGEARLVPTLHDRRNAHRACHCRDLRRPRTHQLLLNHAHGVLIAAGPTNIRYALRASGFAPMLSRIPRWADRLLVHDPEEYWLWS